MQIDEASGSIEVLSPRKRPFFRDTFALVAPDALASHLFLDSSWLETLLLLLFFTTHRGASKHASLMQPVSEGVAKVMSQ